MTTSTVSEQMRHHGFELQQTLGKAFLGSREDRDELTFWVENGSWTQSAQFLKERGFDHLSDLTAVDYLDRNPRFDVMVILSNHQSHEFVRLKTLLLDDQELDSLVELWSGANWFEREVFDLFGIKFKNHPQLKRILLPDDYTGHPLRKDYPVTGPASSHFR